MKKTLFLFFTIAAHMLSLEAMDKNQIYRELLGKVKKLEGPVEIYVGAATSDAGEPIFFAMEKIDNQSFQVWNNYKNLFKDSSIGILGMLRGAIVNCGSPETHKHYEGNVYMLNFMDKMCSDPNKNKISRGIAGIPSGVIGFGQILSPEGSVYVAYASSQPITGPFKPQQEDHPSSPEQLEKTYPNIIISVGVDMKPGKPIARHRGIFRNPMYDIQNKYRNVSMKLHGWAGMVEKEIFHKKYMVVNPNILAADLLHRSIKPGDMYIGVEQCPYPSLYEGAEELKKKFPPINQELLGIEPYCEGLEPIHTFDLNVLSKYYTGK